MLRSVRSRFLVWFALMCLFLTGCAHQPLERFVEDQSGESYWWYVRFKLDWPEDQDPDFSLHPLIADRIVRPVLRDNDRFRLPLWRFHRRAGRDSAGHQFSFIFYSDTSTARGIEARIKSDPLALALLEEQVILEISVSDGEFAQRTSLAATSDRSWPPEIQRSWPYFIMGVSLTWLDHIEQLDDREKKMGEADIEQLLDHYRALNNRLSAQWIEYGRHAYFHHVNALFGYEPVYLFETGELHNF